MTATVAVLLPTVVERAGHLLGGGRRPLLSPTRIHIAQQVYDFRDLQHSIAAIAEVVGVSRTALTAISDGRPRRRLDEGLPGAGRPGLVVHHGKDP